MKIEPIESSETSAIKTRTPGNYPKENITPNDNITTQQLNAELTRVIPKYKDDSSYLTR